MLQAAKASLDERIWESLAVDSKTNSKLQLKSSAFVSLQRHLNFVLILIVVHNGIT